MGANRSQELLLLEYGFYMMPPMARMHPHTRSRTQAYRSSDCTPKEASVEPLMTGVLYHTGSAEFFAVFQDSGGRTRLMRQAA